MYILGCQAEIVMMTPINLLVPVTATGLSGKGSPACQYGPLVVIIGSHFKLDMTK
jgi:hypothetical protein